MTTNNILSHILRFVFYLLAQIFIFRFLVAFNVGFCFVYVAAILTLPKEISHVNSIILSFVLGMAVDAFYNTMGMHAAACTVIGFARPYIAQLTVPQQRGFDEKKDYTIKSLGLNTFLIYASILVAMHHFIVFFLELGSFSLFFVTLLKIFCSIVFTLLVVVLIQYFGKADSKTPF
jgi:hypothetical protein